MFCPLLLCSCLRTLYGIRKPLPVSDAEIVRVAQQFRIPLDHLYELDSLQPFRIFRMQQLGYSNAAKRLHQPLQVMYFDEQGVLLSWHLNCHAMSFPNLKWNRHHAFMKFPPPGNCPLDSLLTHPILQAMMRPLFSKETRDLVSARYHVVIIWNQFMGRQSKRLVRLVQRNAAIHADKRIKLYYVNNDNYHSMKGIRQLHPDVLKRIDSLILHQDALY